MVTDATGAELKVGDTVGAITLGRWAAVLTGKILKTHQQLITVEVLTAFWSGAPQSSYAHLPKIGAEQRLNAFRVFRLGPCPCEQRQKALEEAWND